MNLEKCFFRDVHNLLSEKKIVTSFSGREIHLVLVFFYWGFSLLLLGTWNVGGGCLLLLLWKRGFAKRKRGWEGWRRAGLGWVGEEWREKGLGWYIRRNTHTLGDCEKPHIALVVWDIYAYLIRLDMICEPFCHKSNVFRCFPYALVLGLAFFRFQIPFLLCLARGFFFLRESMGLFYLLGSRLVKI